MKPKAILFDLDGLVIIGRERLFSHSLAEKQNISTDEIEKFFLNDFRECSFGRADLKEKITPYLEKWKYEGTVDDLLRFWFETENKLDKDVLSIVKDLRLSGIGCYIATRQEKYRMAYLLNDLGLKDYFDGVFCTCDIGYDKWQDEYWKSVFDRLKIEPKEIMFFCDSQKNIDSANRLGVRAYFYSGIDVLKDKINTF